MRSAGNSSPPMTANSEKSGRETAAAARTAIFFISELYQKNPSIRGRTERQFHRTEEACGMQRGMLFRTRERPRRPLRLRQRRLVDERVVPGRHDVDRSEERRVGKE